MDEADARAWSDTFEPGARDRVSGEPMRSLFSDASDRALRGPRAGRESASSLQDAPGIDPGELFGAFDRGSLITYMGLQPPPLPDDLRGGRDG